ncbi:MAG: methyltransferase domain-containing protein [Candidatus Bathyarchaeota archaeon]|nr:MAG: methyltransferase domain-containing protein [Candidatus Bathyarchaeota archaeon]
MNGTVFNLTKSEIEEAVRRKYSDVATNPQGSFNFPVGKEFALAVGYPKTVLDALPESFVESFTGANNPQPYIHLQRGETVLDLGCGAGLDLYFYAKTVGPKGRAIGVDISAEMIEKARMNLKRVGMHNVELRCGRSDEIPLGDDSVDVVASNGIYNLSPDKEAVMHEVLRVLKPGGRTVFSEIVLQQQLPEGTRKNINDWFRCIGGALPEQAFLDLLKQSGFEKVEMIAKVRNARTGHEYSICANVRAYKPGSI